MALVQSDIIIADGSTLSLESGEFLSGVIVNSGGHMFVNSGGTANATTVNSYGFMHISSGGTANDTAVNDWALLYISSGGMANDTTVNSYGRMYISSGGTANATTVNDWALLYISSGGMANDTTVNGGSLYISSGCTANNTTINANGLIRIFSGGTANDIKINSGAELAVIDCTANRTTVNSGGTLTIYHGGTATEIMENGGHVRIDDKAESVSFVSNTISGMLFFNGIVTIHSNTTAENTTMRGGRLYVYSGGIANSTTVINNGTIMYISSGGIANSTTVINNGSMYISSGGIANSTTVNSRGRMSVNSGGTANDTTVNSYGYMHISSGGTADSTTIEKGGSVTCSTGGKLTGQMNFATYANVFVSDGGIVDFNLSGLKPESGTRVNNLSIFQGIPFYTLTIADSQVNGSYTLAEGAAGFNSTITVQNTLGETLGTLMAGETLSVGETDYTLNLNEAILTLTVEMEEPVPIPNNLVGTKDRVSWNPAGTGGYVVEYSMDDFAHALHVDATGNAVDMLDLPAGNYQWRVKADANSDWAVGNKIVSETEPAEPKVVQAVEDGNNDLFFASANGTWSNLYYAQHVGSINDWAGTNEMVSANGKGRIRNLFFGSFDPNVLCLTDGENGDAIFVDDVYTDLPEEIEEHTARLYRILEIRAGAGDDIVDITSQRFEYVGEGLRIHGGNGNDTIWANKGDNLLFGDAGNDRIVGASGNDVIAGGIGNDRLHGGGGDDIFTFGENWGADTVEQLADGFVTLWFASGDESKWNADTLTYTDGENSITVSGVAAEQITLKFGDDGSDQFAALSAIGAFLDFTSERIFEESHIV